VRRRPTRDPALAGAAAATSPVDDGQPVAPAWAAAIQVEPRPAAAAVAESAAPAAEAEPAPPAAESEAPVRPAPVEESLRRTAFAEFTSLASTSDKTPSRSR
jgi:hypothetical protein